MMDKFSIKALLSSMTLLSAFALTGCDQAPQEDHTNIQSEQATEQNMSDEIIQSSSAQDTQNLSKGNMLNIARDIAKLQLETDDYIALLKQSQNSLEQAIQNKNVQQLKATSGDLNQELHGLHDTLLSLNLKVMKLIKFAKIFSLPINSYSTCRCFMVNLILLKSTLSRLRNN